MLCGWPLHTFTKPGRNHWLALFSTSIFLPGTSYCFLLATSLSCTSLSISRPSLIWRVIFVPYDPVTCILNWAGLTTFSTFPWALALCSWSTLRLSSVPRPLQWSWPLVSSRQWRWTCPRSWWLCCPAHTGHSWCDIPLPAIALWALQLVQADEPPLSCSIPV